MGCETLSFGVVRNLKHTPNQTHGGVGETVRLAGPTLVGMEGAPKWQILGPPFPSGFSVSPARVLAKEAGPSPGP